MKKFKLTFQKGILFCLVLLMIFSVTSCKKHEDTPKDDVKITLESDKYTLQKTDVAKLIVTVTGSTLLLSYFPFSVSGQLRSAHNLTL